MTGVLVDTSVWIDHFRHRNAMLVSLLNRDQVRMHPTVIAELACGTLPSPRTQTLGDLALLPPVQVTSLSETVGFIEREALYGLGCGLVDMMVLASTRMTPGAVLWTLDKRLADLADRFNVAMPDP